MKFGKAKSILVAGLAVSLAASLGACGNSNSASGGGDNTITFFGNQPTEAFKPLINAFEKANPGITVKYQTTTGEQNGYQQALQTRASGGQLADVFMLPPEVLHTIVKNGLVKDVSNESFTKNLDQKNKDTFTVDGKLYGMSINSWIYSYAYNKDLLAKVGYKTIPDTWDEFITMLKKLKAAGVKTPYLEEKGNLDTPLQGWIGSDNEKKGGPTLDAQIASGKTTFAKGYAKYFNAWDELIKQGLLTPDVAGLNGDQVKSEFIAGRTAIMPTGPWDVANFKKAGMNFAYGRIPVLEKGNTPYCSGAADAAWSINSKTTGKKLENAEKFLSYIDSKAGLDEYFKTIGNIPTVKGYTAKIDPALKVPYDLYLKTGNYYVQTLDWPETGRTALLAEQYSQLQQVAQGSITPDQAAANLDVKLKTLA